MSFRCGDSNFDVVTAVLAARQLCEAADLCYDYGAFGGVMNFCLDGDPNRKPAKTAAPNARPHPEERATKCEVCHRYADCAPSVDAANATFACACGDGYLGDGLDCAEKLGDGLFFQKGGRRLGDGVLRRHPEVLRVRRPPVRRPGQEAAQRPVPLRLLLLPDVRGA